MTIHTCMSIEQTYMHGFHTKQDEINKHVWQAKHINLDTKENS